MGTGREHFPVWTPGAVAHQADWLRHMNEHQTEAELERLRECIGRRPFGEETWTVKIARTVDLESTLRPVGRPTNKPHEQRGLFEEPEEEDK